MISDVEQAGRSDRRDAGPFVSIRLRVVLLGVCFVFLPVLFALVMALQMTGGGPSPSKWLPGALGNAGFVKYALITMALAAALFIVCVAMWRIGARARMRRRSEEGGAMIEFALILPFAMGLVLLLRSLRF